MRLSSLPDPWALCVVLVILPTLLTRGLPAATRWTGRGMAAGATPVAAALVLPEFWLTSALRRRGVHVPAAVHAYDRAVEAMYRGLRTSGPFLSSVHGPAQPVRLRWVVLPAALLLVLWYGEPLLPTGGLRVQAVAAKCAVLRADTAVTGGNDWSEEGGVCPLPPVAPSTETTPLAGTPFGIVDRLSNDGRQIVVTGWAVDPSTLEESVEVRVYVDPGRRDAHAVGVQATAPRPDVAAAKGVGPHTGFSAVLPSDRDRHEVCVYAITLDQGVDALLGCRTLPTVR